MGLELLITISGVLPDWTELKRETYRRSKNIYSVNGRIDFYRTVTRETFKT
jgi:hypothetical protein